MKKFDIYVWEDDMLLGSVVAKNVVDAEIKASEDFQIESDRLYALSAEMED